MATLVLSCCQHHKQLLILPLLSPAPVSPAIVLRLLVLTNDAYAFKQHPKQPSCMSLCKVSRPPPSICSPQADLLLLLLLLLPLLFHKAAALLLHHLHEAAPCGSRGGGSRGNHMISNERALQGPKQCQQHVHQAKTAHPHPQPTNPATRPHSYSPPPPPGLKLQMHCVMVAWVH